MKQLRKPTSCDTLLNIFDEIGVKMEVEKVLQIAGIKNYNTLKALFSYIRKAPHIPEENRIDVAIDRGLCI